MKLNRFAKRPFSGRSWIFMSLLGMLVTAFFWQEMFFMNMTAVASPSANVIFSVDLGNKIQNTAGKDADTAKGFVQDTTDKLKSTAKKNASKVDNATGDSTNFIGRKAKRDQVRIENKAEKDSVRTQKAIDDTKNIVERAVDSVKDTFGG